MVKEICGKDISKKEQQSDWGDPNLSEKQISYAAQDTEFLFEIKKIRKHVKSGKKNGSISKKYKSYSGSGRYGNSWIQNNNF